MANKEFENYPDLSILLVDILDPLLPVKGDKRARVCELKTPVGSKTDFECNSSLPLASCMILRDTLSLL